MSRNIDQAVMDSGYRRKLQYEIYRKGNVKGKAREFAPQPRAKGEAPVKEVPGLKWFLTCPIEQKGVQLPEIVCAWCHKPIKTGARVHIQRSTVRVRAYHQACWDVQLIS